MDRRTSTRLSKFLSLVLRHRPDEYGLDMDAQGFVDFEALIDVLVAEDVAADTAEQDVQELVEGSDRRRFEIADGKIRALYGHSSRIHLEYPAQDPPTTLYHGTTAGSARRVAQEGLTPAGRALVHLSATEEEARSVGGRHTDDPIILEIDTAAAEENGIAFHQATDLIWLCPKLPADVVRVPELPEAPPAPERSAAPPISAAPAAAEPEVPEGFQRRRRRRGGGRR